MSDAATIVRAFRILAIAAAVAVPAEGVRRVAYHDPAGILTACAGSTSAVQPGQQFSLDDCTGRLSDDMLAAIAAVERCAPGLPEHQAAAFADAVFNLGPKIVCDRGASTAARLLAAGRVLDACDELPKWNKARIGGVLVPLPGLTARRERERQLCLSGVM